MTEPEHTPESLEARLKKAKAFPDGPEEHYRDVAEDAIAALREHTGEKCETHYEVYAPNCPVCLVQERDEAGAEDQRLREALERIRDQRVPHRCEDLFGREYDQDAVAAGLRICANVAEAALHGYEPEDGGTDV